MERINILERRTASDILGLQRISVVEVHARTDIRQYYPAGWMPTVRRPPSTTARRRAPLCKATAFKGALI